MEFKPMSPAHMLAVGAASDVHERLKVLYGNHIRSPVANGSLSSLWLYWRYAPWGAGSYMGAPTRSACY